MSGKKVILICFLLYMVLTGFLFFQKKIFAKERNHLQTIIKEEKIVEKDKREMLRAFYTAPPVIPHEVESQNSKDCLECHLKVTRLDDGRVGMQTPHPQFSNCMQCHVRGQNQKFNESTTSWEGLEEPKRGDRWFTVSPPTIPHRILLRENCLSCHGPENPYTRMRTTHPQRTSCLQCHIPDYRAQF